MSRQVETCVSRHFLSLSMSFLFRGELYYAMILVNFNDPIRSFCVTTFEVLRHTKFLAAFAQCAIPLKVHV